MQFLKCQQKIKLLVFYCCTLLLLTSCAPRELPPVVERETLSEKIETDKLGGRLIRIVQSGDTLYSIAFAHSLDVYELAQWNDISDTGRLLTGQRIRLTKPIGFQNKVGPAVVKARSAVKTQVTVKSKKTNVKPSVVINEPSKPLSKKEVVHQKKTPIKSYDGNVNWQWPSKGRVVESFSIAKGQQGIAIEGAAKAKVWATKGGEVVYVGSGLKGYGNLIIVKHSEHFLSAYAHNFITYVVEGQLISSKDIIGLVGRDNKNRNALHFQIRKNGQPVNPLGYLPKR